MRQLLVAILLLGISGGCFGGAKRITLPSIDAVTAGQDAIAEFDTNHNGQIDGSEFDKVPSIKSAIPRIDKNGDKQVSAEEITNRIHEWQEPRIGLLGCSVRVILDGKPLSDAMVTFMPEKFLGPNVKPAIGKSNPQGLAMLTIDDPDLKAKHIGGVQIGFYRVQITADGGKSIPAKYNTDTILGEEVAPGTPCTVTITTYDLKRK